MSKLWLLLLLVAAFQAVHSYPAAEPDYLEDQESTWSIIKDTWGKLKDKYTEMGKEKLQKIISKLKDKLCTQQDFEEDFDFDESDEETGLSLQLKLLKKLKELFSQAKNAAGAEKEKIQKKIEAIKAKICDKLSDVEEDLEFDVLEDPEQSTWGILKETFGKLKDRWNKVSKEKMQKIIEVLRNKFCSEQNDFEEDDTESDDEQDGILNKYKIVKKMKELYEKAKAKYGEKKEKLKEELGKIKEKFCAKLSSAAQQNDFEDDEGDEERGIWGKLGKLAKKGLKKLKGQMKKIMKKGAKYIKNNAIKVTPLECEGKSCKSCISLMIPTKQSVCMQMTIKRINKDTYLTVALTINDDPKMEEEIKLGEVPRCFNVGGFIGKVCLKGLEGKGKSSKGQAKVNFCLAILAEDLGIGSKFCAVYENQKMKMKVEPTLFAGGKDDDGEFLVLDKTEENGIVLDADEFEID